MAYCWGLSFVFHKLFDEGIIVAGARLLQAWLDATMVYHPYSAIFFAIFFFLALSARGNRTNAIGVSMAVGAMVVTVYLFYSWPLIYGPCSVKEAYSPGLAIMPLTLGISAGTAYRTLQLDNSRPLLDGMSVFIALFGTAALFSIWSPWIDLFKGG